MTRKQAHRLLLSLLKNDDLINSVEIMFDSLSDGNCKISSKRSQIGRELNEDWVRKFRAVVKVIMMNAAEFKRNAPEKYKKWIAVRNWFNS